MSADTDHDPKSDATLVDVVARLQAERAALTNTLIRIAAAVGMFYTEDQTDAIVGAIEAAQADNASLRAALEALLREGVFGCRFCDNGKIRNHDKRHDDDCGYCLAHAALTTPPTPHPKKYAHGHTLRQRLFPDAALAATPEEPDTHARLRAALGELRTRIDDPDVERCLLYDIIAAALAAAPDPATPRDPSTCDHDVSCSRCGTRWHTQAEVQTVHDRQAIAAAMEDTVS